MLINFVKKLAVNNIRCIIFVLLLLLIPIASFANGGDQRVVENKYFINLSRAPFTPRVGVKISFLASFVDIAKNKLISEDIVVNIRISKLGEAPKGNFIFEKNDVPVKGGVLELSYTFPNSGLHEIFFDFALASIPERIYEAPDFLLDIQKPLNGYNINQVLLIAFGGFVAGLFIGWFTRNSANAKL